MFNQNQKLLVHSGFTANTVSETPQSHSEPMTFNYWFLHGGFVILISYLLIIAGAGVFIHYVFSLIKEKRNRKK